MFATAKAAKAFGRASGVHGLTLTGKASLSRSKPSRWTDASHSALSRRRPSSGQPRGGQQCPPFLIAAFNLWRDAIQIIRPPLHHLPAFRQVLRMIVSGANLVALDVSKL